MKLINTRTISSATALMLTAPMVFARPVEVAEPSSFILLAGGIIAVALTRFKSKK